MARTSPPLAGERDDQLPHKVSAGAPPQQRDRSTDRVRDIMRAKVGHTDEKVTSVTHERDAMKKHEHVKKNTGLHPHAEKCMRDAQAHTLFFWHNEKRERMTQDGSVKIMTSAPETLRRTRRMTSQPQKH